MDGEGRGKTENKIFLVLTYLCTFAFVSCPLLPPGIFLHAAFALRAACAIAPIFSLGPHTAENPRMPLMRAIAHILGGCTLSFILQAQMVAVALLPDVEAIIQT